MKNQIIGDRLDKYLIQLTYRSTFPDGCLPTGPAAAHTDGAADPDTHGEDSGGNVLLY